MFGLLVSRLLYLPVFLKMVKKSSVKVNRLRAVWLVLGLLWRLFSPFRQSCLTGRSILPLTGALMR